MSIVRTLWLFLPLALLAPMAVHAHLNPFVDDQHTNPWAIDFFADGLLIAVALLYGRGMNYICNRNHVTSKPFRLRQIQFWSGWMVLAIVLCTPIDGFGEVLFWVHMIQHELIMLIAAPCLVLSRPFSALWFGLRPISNITLTPIVSNRMLNSKFMRTLFSPLSAWTIHLVGLWAWHLPTFFNMSLTNDFIHSLQHITFLAISLIFWYSLFRKTQVRSAGGLIYLFTTALHASLLGALLTFSPKPWYEPYINTTTELGFSPLQDQQLGGLIMWVPSGLIFIMAALYILYQLIDDRSPKVGIKHYRSSNG